MNAILRLYPRAWRARYGDEVEALLDEHPASLLDQLDLIRGALDARLHPQVPGMDVAPEQEIPMDRKRLGILAAVGGLFWIIAIASIYVLPTQPPDYYTNWSIAMFALPAGMALIGIALAELGTRRDSRTSMLTGHALAVVSVLVSATLLLPWPLMFASVFAFPVFGTVAVIRGARNRMISIWFVGIPFVIVGSLFAVSAMGGTDGGWAMALVGFAAFLLARSAFTTRADAPVESAT